MRLAISDIMSNAKKLIEDIEAFRERNPGHQESTARLVRAVERIAAQFTGETKEELLRKARDTFLKQTRTLQSGKQTRAKLERLKRNQQELIEALGKLSPGRPDGVTLH